MNITIHNPSIHFHGAPPMASALIAAMLREEQAQEFSGVQPPQIGEYWQGQGGIYIGARLIDGAVHHVVIPGGVEFDHEDVPFSRVELVVAEGDELNGHSDWRAPDQEDLMLAYINAREHFEQEGSGSIYWTRNEHHGWPWAVDFEYGFVYGFTRYDEFRVRPFRHVVLND